MTEEELKALEKEVKKAKRVASEWASQLHDLVEDRLPAAFEDIHPLAQSTYEACKAWKDASDRLQAAKSAQ
ncbi:MAG: CCE_0567 family metalloprotein [Methylohalobius sp. ZOD2]